MVKLIDTYAPMLTEKQREVLELYYFEDLSLAEIAQNSGISRQGVHDAIKRGECSILELENQLGVVQRNTIIGAMCAQITQDIENIRSLNQSANRDAINESITRIESAVQEINR